MTLKGFSRYQYQLKIFHREFVLFLKESIHRKTEALIDP